MCRQACLLFSTNFAISPGPRSEWLAPTGLVRRRLTKKTSVHSREEAEMDHPRCPRGVNSASQLRKRDGRERRGGA